MSEVIPFRSTGIDRAALSTIAKTVENMAAVMRDMAIVMDERDKAAADAITKLTGRVVALEAVIARWERERAPRPFSAD